MSSGVLSIGTRPHQPYMLVKAALVTPPEALSSAAAYCYLKHLIDVLLLHANDLRFGARREESTT